MKNINIPEKFKVSLTEEKIKYIIKKIYGDIEYNINFINRFTGNYLTIEGDGLIDYIILSASSGEVEGRNSFLSQFISTVINEFENDDNFINKEIYVFLLNTSEKAKTNYHKFIYRCLLTYGINILNKEKLGINLTPFNSFQDFYNARKEMIRNNNNSSFFEELENSINFYLKVFGANGKEAVFLALVISKITDKPLMIYQVEDNEAIAISNTDKELLERHNIFIDQDNFINDYINKGLITEDKILSLRKTGRFHSNLLKKYGVKKCYLCGCDIQHSVIGAHIQRVTDIEKDGSLTEEQKIQKIIDENNGLWLCANHDKFFEYGIIYFEGNILKINNIINNQMQIEFIQSITNNYKINEVHFNDEMKNYLNLHKNRVIGTL